MKMFKCSLRIDFAFNMSVQCLEHTTQPETIFFSKDFQAAIIYQYFLFVYTQKNIALTCDNSLLFLLLFSIFIVFIEGDSA